MSQSSKMFWSGKYLQNVRHKFTWSYVSGPSNESLLGLTLGQLLDQSAQNFGDRDALVSMHQGPIQKSFIGTYPTSRLHIVNKQLTFFSKIQTNNCPFSRMSKNNYSFFPKNVNKQLPLFPNVSRTWA